MHYRLRNVLFLILGLAAATGVFAQDEGVTLEGAVITEVRGEATFQIGNSPPRAYRPGTAIPAGTIVRTGEKSSVTLVFPDDQICVIGEDSVFRVTSYAFFRRDSGRSRIALNLISGSLRLVMGEIARSNPAAVRVQVGVATLGVDAASAPRTDASVVVLGPVAITVERGSVTAFLPSGPPQPVAAGQGLLFVQDRAVVRGTSAQIVQQLGALPQGAQMQRRFAALQGMNDSIAQMVLTLSTPALADQLLAPLDSLPPPGDLAQGLPEYGAAATPPTGASGGGLPCGASCN